MVDYSSLGNDVGVDAKTIRRWISILEASFLRFRLPPYFENFGKRMIKSAKFYLTDVGLLCFLLGIRKPEQVTRDPLVVGIFENLVIAECLKARYNCDELTDLYFFRDSNGNEVDLLWQEGHALAAAEIKSASTFSMGLLKGLRRFRAIVPEFARSFLVYNGDSRDLSDGTLVRHFTEPASLFS